ncbi:MAG TPA: CHAT domain-containing protein [Kofleriaceae bacterium]|jgi:CHAT domain-containing protein
MRVASLVVALLVSVTAVAGPRPPKPPPSADEVELKRLDAVLRDLEMKQAYVPAAKLARKLYELQRKISGDDSPMVRIRQGTLAGMLAASGDDLGAHKLYLDMLADAEAKHGAESREVLRAIPPALTYLYVQGRYAEIEPYLQRELAISKKLDGDHTQSYAGELIMYASLLGMRGEYAAGLRIYEQAYAIDEANAKSKDDLGMLGVTQALAYAYWQANQQPKAVELYNRAIHIVDTTPLANVMMQAGVKWSIALIYRAGGRDDLAKPLTIQVIDEYTKEIARVEAKNPDDPSLPGMYGQLAMNDRAIDDLADADKLMRKAYDLDARTTHTDAWDAVLADLDRAEGHPQEALAVLEKAAASFAKKGKRFEHTYDMSIANVLEDLGKLGPAAQKLIAYRDSTGAMYGKRHPLYGLAEMQLANIYMRSGDFAAAGKALADSLDIAERELSNVLQIGTESDHELYFAQHSYVLDSAINFAAIFAPKNTTAARLGLETVLRRKGRVLDAAAASMATIRSKLSPDDKKLLDDLAAARSQLAKLTVAGPSATGDDDYTKTVAALEEQIAQLEIKVGDKSAQYRAVSQAISLAAVQKLVPKGARLVEIINFQPYDAKVTYYTPTTPKPARHYAAYVLAQTGDPVFVDLGSAQPIDDAIVAFRKAVSNPKNTHATDLGHALYTLTLGKLAGALGGATEILIAPDGALNLVPFSALVDDKGQLLLEHDNFTYLTSGRDLLRLAVRSKAQGGGVMFANPAFDATGGGTSDGTRGARSADLSSLMWPQLPGTGEEADLVEKTWAGFTDFRGARATETALKQLHGPRILHLATHGFFLADEPPKPSRDTTGQQIATPMGLAAAPQPTGGENPLLRSGLALAGANKLKSGDDDGILTALEASGLDLWGTELVVLSACDTGNGKVTNGDGVYGLRRALVIAGAEGLVMSLWQVDDAATRDLMAGYYARLKAGKPRSDALRDIQLEIHHNPKYAHPFYWAAFLAAGDNSPL